MDSASKSRKKLFETAARLFYQYGSRAIGVDTIAAESGVGKMTLYRHYPGKDDLVVAFLNAEDEKFWLAFQQATAAAATPRAQLLTFFEDLEKQVSAPGCCGCPFLVAAAEYPQLEAPAHRAALKHKEAVWAKFQTLGLEAGAANPEMLADQLVLIMDGAYMAARLYGPANPAAMNLAATASMIIYAHIPRQRTAPPERKAL